MKQLFEYQEPVLRVQEHDTEDFYRSSGQPAPQELANNIKGAGERCAADA